MGIHKKFTENPEVFLTGRVMGDIFARVEEHNTLFEKDLGAHVEEFKVELHSEIEELKTKVEWGVQERRALEREVALLGHKPPPAPYPDPLLQQIPTLAGSMHACMTHLRAVDKEYRGCTQMQFRSPLRWKKFRGAQTQIMLMRAIKLH